MAEDIDGSAPPAETKHDIATRIYTVWRNTHINNIAHEAFAKVEAAAEHLIAEIEKHL